MRCVLVITLCLLKCLTPSNSYSMEKTAHNLAGYFPNQPKRIVIQSDTDLSGHAWSITDQNDSVLKNGKLGKSMCGKGPMTAQPYNYQIDFTEINEPGQYHFIKESSEVIEFHIRENPIAFLIPQILDAMRMRRSGSHLANHHGYSHPGDEACPLVRRKKEDNQDWIPDPKHAPIDMLGGWYDAGDFLKFTLTTSYAIYHLARAYELNPQAFDQLDPIEPGNNRLLEELKHGVDFLLKTFPNSKTFIIQVGDDADHMEDSRLPEEDKLDGKRPAHAALSPTQMGSTAAAIAISSQLFKNAGQKDYAELCLETSEKIFKAAENSKEKIAWWQAKEGFEVYYADRTAEDNLGIAAYELYRITGDSYYLGRAGHYTTLTKPVMRTSWSSYHLALFQSMGDQEKYKKSLQHFAEFANQPENLWNTTELATWGSLFSFFAAANSIMIADDEEHRDLVWSVYDFTFGINPWNICFVANQSIPHSISSSYALVYKLNPQLFPAGEIAEGPARKATIDRLKAHFYPPHDENQWHHQFNAEELAFFENPGNFVTMETTIGGLADGVLFLALLSR